MASLNLQQIRDDMSFLDDWEEKYRYVIDLGRDLEPLPDAFRSAENKVPGCVSQVWLRTDVAEGDAGEGPHLKFMGDSDAMIVKGLVAILIAIYSGKSAEEIRALDAEGVLAELGLEDNLTPQRSNGLKSMVQRIRADAERAMDA